MVKRQKKERKKNIPNSYTWHCICSWRSNQKRWRKKTHSHLNERMNERMRFSFEWKSVACSLASKNTNEELCWRKIFSRLGYCIKFAPLSFMTFEKYHNIMPFLSFYYVVLFITPTTIVLAGASSATITDAMVVVVIVLVMALLLLLLWLSRVRTQWKCNPFFVTFFPCNNVALHVQFWNFEHFVCYSHFSSSFLWMFEHRVTQHLNCNKQEMQYPLLLTKIFVCCRTKDTKLMHLALLHTDTHSPYNYECTHFLWHLSPTTTMTLAFFNCVRRWCSTVVSFIFILRPFLSHSLFLPIHTQVLPIFI